MSVTDAELRFAVAPLRNVQFRDATATPDGSWTISGYAAVFDQETTLYDGTFYTMRESIAPGAFDAVLATNPVVHLNLGHDMNRSVAATDVPMGEIGSLTLRADPIGLNFLARVDCLDPDAQAMAIKMSRGVIRQASFMFTIAGQVMTEEQDSSGHLTETRRVTEVRDLFDVCATPAGAYPQTSANLRSMAALWTGSVAPPGPPRHLTPQGEGVKDVIESSGVPVSMSVARARAMLAKSQFPVKDTE